MDNLQQVFLSLPDTVIITDVYWYILDFNHKAPFSNLQKGINLERYMPDCTNALDDEYSFGGNVYQRKVTAIYERDAHVGYTVCLSDITEKKKLIEQRRVKSTELEKLTNMQKQANSELEEYAHQAEALSAYAEQLRIARSIHDDAGHAITALHTISQMCIRLKNSDPAQYSDLLDEGIAICEKAAKGKAVRQFASLRELLEAFREEHQFPIEISIFGEEPGFIKPLYEVIHNVCKEAYYNTLSHSLADKLMIEAYMEPMGLMLRLYDNGRFRGAFEKGFGLVTMEENIQASGGSVTFRAVESEGFAIAAEWRAKT